MRRTKFNIRRAELHSSQEEVAAASHRQNSHAVYGDSPRIAVESERLCWCVCGWEGR